MSGLNQADRALCEAFVDGLLTPERQRWFERRMATEPRLAQTVRVLASDDALRRLERTDGVDVQRAQRLRPWAWTASLAIGLSVLTVFGIELAFGKPAPAFDTALAPGFESAGECIDSFPALRGLRPHGLDALLGADGTPNVGATEFHVRATAAEGELVGASREVELSTGTFVVSFEVASDAEVLVVSVPKFGETDVLFPAYSNGAGARLPAGSHVLPGPRFDVVGDRVRYRPGFTVPVGAGELEILVAARTRGGSDVARFALKGRRPIDQIQQALVSAGYEVRRLRVTEPVD